MNAQNIKKILAGQEQAHVDLYIEYLSRLQAAKDKKKQLKNPWMKFKSDEVLADYFKKVSLDGLDFDGVHITLQSTGSSHNSTVNRHII